MTKAGVYRDDSLIRDLRIAFADRVPDGRLDITISPLEVSHD